MKETFPSSLKTFLVRLRNHYGLRLIILLTTIFFLLEGFVLSLVTLNQLPYYRDVLNVNETRYQVFILISNSSWTMKSLFGVLSDLYPLFGYHKTSLMAIVGICGTTSLFLLAFLDIPPNPILLAPFLVFLVMLELSVIDLMCEGKYSKIIYEKKIAKADIISWIWIWRLFGNVIGGSIIGTFVMNYSAKYIYYFCFAASFPALILIFAGFMGEEYVPYRERKFLTEKFASRTKMFILAISIALFSVGMILANIYGSEHVVFIYSITVSVLLGVLGYFFMPTPLFRSNLFIFLQEALYIRIMGALDYWYTASKECVPNGPNFDMNFYLTVTVIIGSISSVVGIILFQNFTSNWTFRFAFLFAIFVRVLGSLFDLFVVSRENIRLGLSDKFTIILGDSVIMDIAYMICKMSSVLLTTRLVSKGFESTTYAILAGYHDFGRNVSISIGTALIMRMKINFNTIPCHYENISMLIVICHLIMPLLAVPLVYILIPNIKLSDTESFQQYKNDTDVEESWDEVDSLPETHNEFSVSAFDAAREAQN